MRTPMPLPYDIVGYTYEADIHCTNCAVAEFGQTALDACEPIDDYGNYPVVVFRDMLEPGAENCGSCLEVIA